MTAPTSNDLLLDVRGLKKHFPIRAGLFSRVVRHVKAVDGISFFIRKGETLGLVGESGCGKTTAGRTILRAYEPTSGEIWFNDRKQGWIDLAKKPRAEMPAVWQNMQLVFQDPFSSLNPRRTLLKIIGEPLIGNKLAKGSELEDIVSELLKRVGLHPEFRNRYPHAFSGGQRQRIVIARALALNPELLICDEPVSALDVSIQAQILNLLQDLQQDLGLTYLFVAHNLSVVEHICDRIAVMYVGKLVETAEKKLLFEKPLHPYTEALMASVPIPDPRSKKMILPLPGEVADPSDPPSGCYFHPRCRYCEEICKTKEPELREVLPGRFVSCHFAGDLKLKGALEFTKKVNV